MSRTVVPSSRTVAVSNRPSEVVWGTSLIMPVTLATVGNEALVTSTLNAVKAAGFDVNMQGWANSSTAADWIMFLDLAQERQMKIVILLDPLTVDPPVYDPFTGVWDLGKAGDVLVAVRDHPALWAVSPIDEPFEQGISTNQLRSLYDTCKALGPNTPIMINYSRQIMHAENNNYGPNTRFASGQADIVNISSLEFRDFGQPGDPKFQETRLRDTHSVSRALVQERDPSVQLTTTFQTFGDGSGYYMPTVSEVTQMMDILFSEEYQALKPLDGVFFQTWGDKYEDTPRDSLGDVAFNAQLNRIQSYQDIYAPSRDITGTRTVA